MAHFVKPGTPMIARHLALGFVFTAACIGQSPADDTAAPEGCEGPLGKPMSLSNINAMTACCQAEPGGKAHCLDNSKVPENVKGFLAQCDSGAASCVPDSFLATGAAEPPATCTAFGGQGVCLSKCIPQVQQNEGLLKPDTCTGSDELCVPCTNPLDGKPTGACDLLTLATCVGDQPVNPPGGGSCDDPATCNYDANCPPVIDPATLTSCGADAHCLDSGLVPSEFSARLGKCDDQTKLCVPDDFIKTGGKFTPATCKSVLGAEGRCLSKVLPDVQKQSSLLPQDTCTANEACTPCFSPIDGSDTGACKLSCDTGPTEAAKTFAQCSNNRGKCVPKDVIPDAQEKQLARRDCQDNTTLCVPNEILAGGPFPACTANSLILGNYTGVCLSTVLDFGIQGVALSKGDCNDGYKCAPCTQNGQPTGAPGCPAQ